MRVFRGVKIALFVLIGSTLFGYVVMRLWNWLVPGIFGWHSITYLQAIGLLLLSKILFGGFHRHGGHRGRQGWKREMKQRFAQMTPEEREQFRAGMRGRWGHCGPNQEERERFRAEMRGRWGRGGRGQTDEVRFTGGPVANPVEKGTV